MQSGFVCDLVRSQVQLDVAHHLHEALSTLWGDDSEVWLAAVDHLGARRWGWRLGQDNFPQTVAVWDCEESRWGPGTGVSVSWEMREGPREIQQVNNCFLLIDRCMSEKHCRSVCLCLRSQKQSESYSLVQKYLDKRGAFNLKHNKNELVRQKWGNRKQDCRTACQPIVRVYLKIFEFGWETESNPPKQPTFLTVKLSFDSFLLFTMFCSSF